MKETNVPWSVGEALLALMIISVLSFLVGSLVLPFLTDTGTQFLLAGTLQTVFIFVVLYYYLNLKHRVTFQNIGFRTRPFFSTILRAMSWGIGIFLVVIVSGTVIDHFLPGQPQLQPFAKLVLEADNGWDLLLPLFWQ